MAMLGTALMEKVLGHSEAEKAFRPWWDTLEDQLIYVLVMVGLIVVPTAIIMGTPLDCNFCQDNHCAPYNNSHFDYKDPGFNAWWVKKLCTLNGSVEPFMLYFPYFLLLVALVLWLIEKMFIKVFAAGLKLETFHKFLVKEKVLGGDDKPKPPEIRHPGVETQDCTDGGLEAIELKQSFKGTSNYFMSYLVRTVLEIGVAGSLLVWISTSGLPVIKHQDTIQCNVHGYWYECSGAPAQFYLYVLYITAAITASYLILNFYNLLWLLVPCIGGLSRVMRTYRSLMMETAEPGQSEEEVLGELYHIYYNNVDLRLLLDLLAASGGVAPAINVMTLFDKKFHSAVKPEIVKINLDSKLGVVRLEFQEPKTGVRAALSRIPNVNLFYVAEIKPPADKAVEGFEFKRKEKDSQAMKNNSMMGDMELVAGGSFESLTGFVQTTVFTGLKPETVYKLKVSTILNGRTISEVMEEVGEKHEAKEAEIADLQERRSN